ncbi:MAG: bifunctional phosphoribosylaminoimidazolecarboxamide formyltransferase/inosine monophosphate cyclohydrolase [Blastocatellia bacterium]
MTDSLKIRRALISLSDKTGAVEFCRSLVVCGVEIISTGGTANLLRSAGLPVTDVSEITGFPEMLDGRIKTLHPKIHGALLGLRDKPEHTAAMRQFGIEPIDLVVVNLYPFEETVASDDVSPEEAIENIDIGGPSMIRSAAKNWRSVAVVTDPSLYQEIKTELVTGNGSISLKTRKRLAALAFTRTAAYDVAISRYLSKQLSAEDLERLKATNPLGNRFFYETETEGSVSTESESTVSPFTETFKFTGVKVRDLRYGENPHQRAALYAVARAGGIANAEVLNGKEMSFNNYLDADAALAIVSDFSSPAAAIIKHTNPSGVGIGESSEEAFRRALATDPISAFGGIVAFNRKLDAAAAAAVMEIFVEIVAAPDFEPEAFEILAQKRNLRILRVSPELKSDARTPVKEILDRLEIRQISGGLLLQEKDLAVLPDDGLKIVTDRQPDEIQLRAMLFAWRVCKHVRSNAIVIANESSTIGVGAGQMNRVDSIRLAAMRAERCGLPIAGSALASDAFFPFRDNVDEAAKIGVSAIIQPGGSVRDEESIAAANEHGITMAFTGVRHFKH